MVSVGTHLTLLESQGWLSVSVLQDVRNRNTRNPKSRGMTSESELIAGIQIAGKQRKPKCH